jgi:hypothetical protein
MVHGELIHSNSGLQVSEHACRYKSSPRTIVEIVANAVCSVTNAQRQIGPTTVVSFGRSGKQANGGVAVSEITAAFANRRSRVHAPRKERIYPLLCTAANRCG